jgi:hypothetical protein
LLAESEQDVGRGSSVIIEMRTCRTKAGRRAEFRAEFREMFRTRAVPAVWEIGMKILGPLFSIEDPDVSFFMRGFPDLASGEPMKAKSYGGGFWKSEPEQVR